MMLMPSVCHCAGVMASQLRYLNPWSPMDHCLVKFRRYGVVGVSMALGMAFKASKPHAIPSVLFLLPACSLKHEHSSFDPPICLLPAAMLPAMGDPRFSGTVSHFLL